MNNIPSFHTDLLDAARQLETTARMIANERWKDCVQKRFYDEYINEYIHVVNMLVFGHDGADHVYNLGMNDIFKIMDKNISEMESMLTGTVFDFSMAFNPGQLLDSYAHPINPVYNDRMELEPWDTKYNGPRPGEMTDDDVKRLLNR